MHADGEAGMKELREPVENAKCIRCKSVEMSFVSSAVELLVYLPDLCC